jgi:WhiB family transcriptional regulator, redox-sensing transcriptional regulator
VNPAIVEAEITARHVVLNQKMRRWEKDAACRTVPPEVQALFIMNRPKNPILARAQEAPAKEVCMLCPVRVLCLQHALEWPEVAGVWGGLNFEERKLLMRPGVIDGDDHRR